MLYENEEDCFNDLIKKGKNIPPGNSSIDNYVDVFDVLIFYKLFPRQERLQWHI